MTLVGGIGKRFAMSRLLLGLCAAEARLARVAGHAGRRSRDAPADRLGRGVGGRRAPAADAVDDLGHRDRAALEPPMLDPGRLLREEGGRRPSRRRASSFGGWYGAGSAAEDERGGLGELQRRGAAGSRASTRATAALPALRWSSSRPAAGSGRGRCRRLRRVRRGRARPAGAGAASSPVHVIDLALRAPAPGADGQAWRADRRRERGYSRPDDARTRSTRSAPTRSARPRRSCAASSGVERALALRLDRAARAVEAGGRATSRRRPDRARGGRDLLEPGRRRRSTRRASRSARTASLALGAPARRAAEHDRRRVPRVRRGAAPRPARDRGARPAAGSPTWTGC